MKPSAPLENPMIPNSYKPDISNLVRSGHFYFGLTPSKFDVDFLPKGEQYISIVNHVLNTW
jgi:hypothetical protein